MAITAAQRTASGTSELTTAERNALKKAAWRLLPLLTIAYMMGWLKDWTGSFTAGLMAMAAIMLATTLLAASLKLLVKQE